MTRYVNAIAGRLSLRPPQRQSLDILDRVMDIAHPAKNTDMAVMLEIIHSEYPTLTDFERDFVSLCFALATGVGKTQLMGAFISYLHLAHGLNNFFVRAPNLTIYNKLIADFTPNTPKYFFKGIAEFAVNMPVIITGDNYNQKSNVCSDMLPGLEKNIHINISKINSEVRGGKLPKIKRLSEYIGESYFDYPLGRAIADGFVKEPAVVTRKDFNPASMQKEEVERLKLEDGICLHDQIKVQLKTYAREMGERIVKPWKYALILHDQLATNMTVEGLVQRFGCS